MGNNNAVAVLFQIELQQLANIVVIINNQNLTE